jgi:hypothetical protein
MLLIVFNNPTAIESVITRKRQEFSPVNLPTGFGERRQTD